jgi:hypothetical protein
LRPTLVRVARAAAGNKKLRETKRELEARAKGEERLAAELL